MRNLTLPLTLAFVCTLAACGSGTSSPTSSVTPTPSAANVETVVLKTSLGEITLELYKDKAPKTVENFVTLAKRGYYNGLTFHRVIPDFMIQGGDPNGDGSGGESIYGDTFEDEDNDVKLERGVIAMANRGPDTNGSQFFIIQAASTPWLQGKHTGFGKVIKGIEIVDKIVNTPANNSRPVTPVTFSVEVK